MQQKRKQLFTRTQPNFYNKLNYHLKKVQPFKGKSKRTVAQQMQLYTRTQKVSIIPNNNKKYYKQQLHNFHAHQQPDTINQQHIPSNLTQVANKMKFYKISSQKQQCNQMRKNIMQRGVSGNKNKKIDIIQRGKSLKYWKVQKTQNKIITQIKGFLNTFLSQDDGCKCGPYCQCKQTLLKWVNVPQEYIQKNYLRLNNLLNRDQFIKISNFGETQYSYNDSQYDFEYQNLPQIQKQLQKHRIQIQKDVIRTQTQSQIFHRKQTQQKLARILLCYSIQDPQVGYVQSMNIVVSGILYHVKNQAQTYAICRKLFHEIRCIYLKDFQECYKHVDFIIKQIRLQVLDLYEHLQYYHVEMKVILFPWVLSLLCVIIPLDYLHFIYIGFVKNGWKFIYKTIIAVFVYYKQVIMEMEQNGDILVFLSASNQKKQTIDWEDIVNYANNIQIIGGPM